MSHCRAIGFIWANDLYLGVFGDFCPITVLVGFEVRSPHGKISNVRYSLGKVPADTYTVTVGGYISVLNLKLRLI